MKKLYISFLALVLLVSMIIPVGVVDADSPQIEVNGGFTLYMILDFDSIKWVGQGNVLMAEFTTTIEYTGSFYGPASDQLYSFKNFQSGAFNSVGTQDFDGTFMGQPGTYTAYVRHQGGMDDVARIEMTIISGTGACENLHGTLIFTANPVYNGSPVPLYYIGEYSGKLHFAP